MSNKCPLCGNSKSKEELFCSDCSAKIQNDYEVELSPKHDITESVSVDNASEVQTATNVETDDEPSANVIKPEKNHKKRFPTALLIFGLLGVCFTAFFIYGVFVRKGNMERSAWESATKENSISSYLSYMEQYLNGRHYFDAEHMIHALKHEEDSIWKSIQKTDNMSKLSDFITQYPGSSYIPLVRSRLDSLMWIAALKTNTVQGYSEYLLMAESGQFNGDYYTPVQDRYDMLFQSYPVTQEHKDKIQEIVSGFYSALSTVSFNNINKFLAPVVTRFFDSGGATRDKISGELVMASAKSSKNTIKFIPNVNELQYERIINDTYKVNVPLTKEFTNEQGEAKSVPGYIVHIGLDSMFLITSIYETKPYSAAP